jgi:hypothetical protein
MYIRINTLTSAQDAWIYMALREEWQPKSGDRVIERMGIGRAKMGRRQAPLRLKLRRKVAAEGGGGV